MMTSSDDLLNRSNSDKREPMIQDFERLGFLSMLGLNDFSITRTVEKRKICAHDRGTASAGLVHEATRLFP